MSKFFSKRKFNAEIDPDEIFLDSSNLPEFNQHQLEGRFEKPISKATFLGVFAFFSLVIIIFSYQSAHLQIISNKDFVYASENNSLRHLILFGQRGIIFDRSGNALVKNIPNNSPEEFSLRSYVTKPGIAHIVGYVSYPAKDSAGNFYQKEFEGKDGVERFYNEQLSGNYGVKIIETDAVGNLISESSVRPPQDGKDLTLSIDARLEEALFNSIKGLADDVGFAGGAGVVMDIHTGEIIAMTSYPEYDPNILTEGKDRQKIKTLTTNPSAPFLNRAIQGLYTPGSIVKPFVALVALNEGVITPEAEIISTGSISVPHPYIVGEESVFNDWKAHGAVDMKRALAVSSNVYFYEIGGGYKDQKGLGIEKIERYMKLFGLGVETGIDIHGEAIGTIPSPSWKEEVFKDEWRVGDTYHTAIGQYGFEITPIQAVRAIAAIANEGLLVTPHIVSENDLTKISSVKNERIKIPPEYFKVVKSGLREAVLSGTAQALNVQNVSVAAKTGTAEVGTLKKSVNSWVIGFFPYENPRFAFAVIMEKGSSKNLIGAPFVMRQFLEWMSRETPEYLEVSS